MAMMEVRGLVRRFGAEKAVDGVSFSAEAGERLALVGRNGAGKTTLLRLLATVLPAHAGSASVDGLDLFVDAPAVRAVTGYLPEGAPLDPDLRVHEYLRFRGRLRGMPRRRLRRRLHEVAAFCDLPRLLRLPVRALSAGQRHAVALADAILHEPRVLLFDDPLEASDPVQARKFAALLSAPEVSKGRVLVFSTHDEALVRAAATRILFLDRGRLVADAPALLPGVPLAEAFSHWTREAEGGRP